MTVLLLLALQEEVQARIFTKRQEELPGAIALRTVRIRCEAATFEVPLRHVRTLRMNEIAGPGFRLAGAVELTELELRSEHGKLRIPADRIDRVEIQATGPIFEAEGFLDLADGGFLPVRMPEEALRLETKYGTLEIPGRDVLAIGADSVATKDFTGKGRILNPSLRFRTAFGTVELAPSAVRSAARWEHGLASRENLALASRGAKATAEGGAEHLIDGDHSKVDGARFYGWCLVGKFMTVELPALSLVDQIHVYLWNGDARRYGYSLEVSPDGRSWKAVARRVPAAGPQKDAFAPERVRFVRIHGLSNTANEAFHLLELEVHGRELGGP
jgi:hypothetical protein